MALTKNSILHGFKILECARVDEVHSTGYLMEHCQSGARLFYLANADDNKVFSIAFRTPSIDDTGVAHILEHSSLCGSRKYRLKEPFLDLVKGSLNTFLNAMTYPDKTVYPLASRNAQDFHNLMDVYLDAVFYPLIYENPNTLRQEGWHYELDAHDQSLQYNGVVYNEMRGVYSSPEASLEREAMRALFPDNGYRFESGGYPDAIPELTQEAFLNFHKTYYSPENSYLYLYGDMDIEATLAYLDEEYLSHFARTGSVRSEIPLQAPLARTAEIEKNYPVYDGSDTSAKTYHELNIVCGRATDYQTVAALRLLESVLLENEASPLRRALLASGAGTGVSGSFIGELAQPVFSIRLAGSERDKRDEFLSVVYKTLQEITINGLDKELLTASLNAMEFKLREEDFGAYPKGLIYCLSVLQGWLYGGDPFATLRYEKVLAALRQGLAGNYYESLIEEYLLDNTHKALVTLAPAPGLAKEEEEAARQKMAALKNKMSAGELEKIAAAAEELHRLQEEPDSEEARASIPILKRSDIRRECERIARVEEGGALQKIYYVPAVTNKIVYANWYFDISSLEPQEIQLCFLLTDLLGKFNSKRYTYQEISTRAIMYTGGVDANVKALSAAHDADEYRLYFELKTRALQENLAQVFDLLEAICLESLLTDEERFRELLEELKVDWDAKLPAYGQLIAMSRIYAYASASGRVNELDQLSYYQFLQKLLANFASEGGKVLGELRDLVGRIFNREQYALFYSCDEEARAQVKEACAAFAAKLPGLPLAGEPSLLPPPGRNEGIIIPGQVQYVAAGGNFARHGHRYVGAMRVLETILRYEYLWTKVRVQGGAYGVTARFELNGLGVFASYRDPQLADTLAAYASLPAWLEKAEFSARELDKFVIGTISGMDTPLTNRMRLDEAASTCLRNVDDAEKQRIRDEVLDVSNADLQKLSAVVADMLADDLRCVVGSEQAIAANAEIFGATLKAEA